VLALGAATIAVTQEEPAPAGDDRPRKIGLEERAGTRLAQIDITVIGPPDVVTNLTTDDFRIKVHLRKVREFRLDRLCEPSGPTRARAASSAPNATDGSPVVTGPAASYLFYFDQPHLTMAGRVRSLEVASDLIDGLITENSRGMIVSNARETIIVQPLTSDRSLLKQALRELEGNRGQWDMYAQLEDERVGDVVRTLNWENDLYGAVAKARLYQKEEYWRTERNLRRLAVTLGQLVDLEPPKALLYFADSTRSNAGAHYLSFFGLAVREEEPALSAMTSDALAGSLAFDEVINQAAAQGIRIYAVEARGLIAAVDIDQPNPTAMSRTRAVPSSSRVRLSDAHSTFESLAAETGGNAFLHGVRAAKIAERIVADSSCVYLASFDPAGYPEDAPLRVIVQVNRDDVELRVRGRIVLQSESARKTSELLRAFSSPDSIPDPFVVKTGVVPTGFGNGNYSALLQISVPGRDVGSRRLALLGPQGTKQGIRQAVGERARPARDLRARDQIQARSVPARRRGPRIAQRSRRLVGDRVRLAAAQRRSNHGWPDRTAATGLGRIPARGTHAGYGLVVRGDRGSAVELQTGCVRRPGLPRQTRRGAARRAPARRGHRPRVPRPASGRRRTGVRPGSRRRALEHTAARLLSLRDPGIERRRDPGRGPARVRRAGSAGLSLSPLPAGNPSMPPSLPRC
jgi:VWFA-related protein